MKRLMFLLVTASSMFLFSACGQTGPLYIPDNPSQMAVPPSTGPANTEEQESDEQDSGEESDPE
jgi:predicted small lipoprotein YifL